MKKNCTKLLLAALLAIIVAFVAADISVHCLHEQVCSEQFLTFLLNFNFLKIKRR